MLRRRLTKRKFAIKSSATAPFHFHASLAPPLPALLTDQCKTRVPHDHRIVIRVIPTASGDSHVGSRDTTTSTIFSSLERCDELS